MYITSNILLFYNVYYKEYIFILQVTVIIFFNKGVPQPGKVGEFDTPSCSCF